MPRPEKRTEKIRRRLIHERPKRAERADAPELFEAPVLPFEEKAGDLAAMIKSFLGVRADHNLAKALSWQLATAEAELNRQNDANAARPTPGAMHDIVGQGAKLARKLQDWSDKLESALFLNVNVLMPGDPPLRAAINHLTDTFERLSEMYPKQPGRPPGRRDAARFVAGPLMMFSYVHAPEATRKQRRQFVHACIEFLKVGRPDLGCPDPDNHASQANNWFRPIEKAAKLAIARRLVRLKARDAQGGKVSASQLVS